MVVMLAILLVSAELAATVFFAFVVKPQLDATKADPANIFRASNDRLLLYEFIPGYQGIQDGRSLHINSLGLRGPEAAPVKDKARIAILGDTVASIGHDDAAAVPYLVGVDLNRRCERGAEVLNFGVPGYGVQELREQFQVKSRGLGLDAAIYLLNLNDFARRDTFYEGADNGLYRMYQPPVLKLPFFAQKALYRVEKGALVGNPSHKPTLEWYQWMIHGTWQQTLDDIGAMGRFAKSHKIEFAVDILPSGLALAGGTNALAAEHKMIVAALQAQGITVASDVQRFMGSPSPFDETDHFTEWGNHVAAAQLASFFEKAFPSVAAEMGCRSGAEQ